jgi:hypothetical protein
MERVTPMPRELMAILEAAAPFEVALMPQLIDHLARQQEPVIVKPIETVSGVSYLGDVGGIACHVQPEDADSVIVVSLTQVRVPRTFLFVAEVAAHRSIGLRN